MLAGRNGRCQRAFRRLPRRESKEKPRASDRESARDCAFYFILDAASRSRELEPEDAGLYKEKVLTLEITVMA